MNEIRYMISEAAKLVDVEQHTLRYWECELELEIPRNEMGHRYYRDTNIELLKAVKILKEKGYQLRAIKMLIPEIQAKNNSSQDSIEELKKTCDEKNLEEFSDESILIPTQLSKKSVQESGYNNEDNSIDKLEQFRIIMKDLLMEALDENNGILTEEVNEEVSNSIIKEMDYLLRIKEEREEERFKKFDRTIREVQNAREEAAVSKVSRRRKKVRFFK